MLHAASVRRIVPILLALTAACAPSPSPAEDPCRVGELVTHWHEPPRALDLVVSLDTHDDEAERAAIAARLAETLRVVASGDVDADGVLEFAPPDDIALTIAPACDAPPISLALGPRDEPDAIADAVRSAVLALAPCSESAPLAVAHDVLASGAHRAHALLVVALVTDEDEPAAPSQAPGLAALLRDAPSALVVLLAGLEPTREVWSVAWDEWRGDPGCSTASVDAGPALSLVDAVRALYERGVGVQLGSWCSDEWTEALDPGQPLAGFERCLCVPRLEPAPDGAADCTVHEQLGPRTRATRCSDLPGRTLESAVDGHERCAIEPSSEGTPGWIALAAEGDPSACCPSGHASIRFVDLELEPGAALELRCVTIPPSGEGCVP